MAVDLMGEYRHKVDSKGRVSLPSKFRKVLSAESPTEDDAPVELVVTLDPMSECLYVFLPDDFNKWVASFFDKEEGCDSRKLEDVKLRRLLKSRAQAVEIDSAGRIKLTPSQCETVGITKDVALIGNTGYFEIWDSERWDSQCSEVDLASLLFG